MWHVHVHSWLLYNVDIRSGLGQARTPQNKKKRAREPAARSELRASAANAAAEVRVHLLTLIYAPPDTNKKIDGGCEPAK